MEMDARELVLWEAEAHAWELRQRIVTTTAGAMSRMKDESLKDQFSALNEMIEQLQQIDEEGSTGLTAAQREAQRADWIWKQAKPGEKLTRRSKV